MTIRFSCIRRWKADRKLTSSHVTWYKIMPTNWMIIWDAFSGNGNYSTSVRSSTSAMRMESYFGNAFTSTWLRSKWTIVGTFHSRIIRIVRFNWIILICERIGCVCRKEMVEFSVKIKLTRKLDCNEQTKCKVDEFFFWFLFRVKVTRNHKSICSSNKNGAEIIYFTSLVWKSELSKILSFVTWLLKWKRWKLCNWWTLLSG